MSNGTKLQEIIDSLGTKKGGRKSTGGEDENPVSKKMSELRTAVAMMEEGEEKPSKKAKGKLSDEVEAMKFYGKKTIPELKDVLRWNLGYGMTGTKDILLMRYVALVVVVHNATTYDMFMTSLSNNRCIDGHVSGRLAR